MLTQPINPVIDSPVFSVAIYGAIAQLGERLTGSQEVVGSIPSSSTNRKRHLKPHGFKCLFCFREFVPLLPRPLFFNVANRLFQQATLPTLSRRLLAIAFLKIIRSQSIYPGESLSAIKNLVAGVQCLGQALSPGYTDCHLAAFHEGDMGL